MKLEPTKDVNLDALNHREKEAMRVLATIYLESAKRDDIDIGIRSDCMAAATSVYRHAIIAHTLFLFLTDLDLPDETHTLIHSAFNLNAIAYNKQADRLYNLMDSLFPKAAAKKAE